MVIYESRVIIELKAEEVDKLITEISDIGKYKYINELLPKYPTLHKLVSHLPTMMMPSQLTDF